MPADPPKPWLRPMQYTHEGPPPKPPEPRDRPPPPAPSTAAPAPTTPATVPARLLDVGEVAGLLGVCRRSIWRWADAGRLPAPLTVGRVRRWHPDVIARWLENGCPRGRTSG